jgi:hypothetical protein
VSCLRVWYTRESRQQLIMDKGKNRKISRKPNLLARASDKGQFGKTDQGSTTIPHTGLGFQPRCWSLLSQPENHNQSFPVWGEVDNPRCAWTRCESVHLDQFLGQGQAS